MINVEDTFFV